MTTETLMTVTEIAECLGISRETLYTEIRAGRLQVAFRSPRKTTVAMDAVEQWVRESELRRGSRRTLINLQALRNWTKAQEKLVKDG